MMGGSNLIDRYVIAESKTLGFFAGTLLAREKDKVQLSRAIELLWMDYKPSLRQLATHGPVGRMIITASVPSLEIQDVYRIMGCSLKARTIFEKGKPYVQLVVKNVPHCTHCGHAGVLLH